MTDIGEKTSYAMETQSIEITLRINERSSFVKLNLEGKCFVRVKYSTICMERIINTIKANNFDFQDNATIISDYFSFVKHK